MILNFLMIRFVLYDNTIIFNLYKILIKIFKYKLSEMHYEIIVSLDRWKDNWTVVLKELLICLRI